MVDLNEIEVTPRIQQLLELLGHGCTNKEIAEILKISPRTVQQHLRRLFFRAGIKDGRKRVKLATARFLSGQSKPLQPMDFQITKHVRIASLVGQGLTNREIAFALGTTEQAVKNQLRTIFDMAGVWTRLELAVHTARHSGASSRPETKVQTICFPC